MWLNIGVGLLTAILLIVAIFVLAESLRPKANKTDDTQVFLDELNKLLITNYQLDRLLKKSVEIIEKNIGATNCLIVVNETESVRSKIVSSGNNLELNREDITAITRTIHHSSPKLIVTVKLEDQHVPMQKLLQSKDIAIIARLTPSSSVARPDIGHLLLGSRKDGTPYSPQDLRIIETIADRLGAAVQNGLRFEEVANYNITLQRKVDEASKKIRRANEKLRQLDDTKDDFISMASHQLRTPLTSVKGYISMVLEGDGGKISHTQREMLGQAFFSSQRMVYLIADLLNVSRLNTGKFIIDPAPVNLPEVVEQELGQLEEIATSRSLTLSYDKPKNFPELMLDEIKTRQVIMNFVDNAIYYTPSGGHINVRLVNNHSSVELRVEDNGIGVPKSEQPHLFTKFYRAGNARKVRPDGTGLGLFMAKKVIIAQGGSLIFDSQEGKGSTFGFTLSKTKLAVSPKKPDAKEGSARAIAKA